MKNAWRSFLKLCLKAKDEETLSQLLGFFLSAEEKDDLASRYTIIKALLEDKLTQRDIAETHTVSIAKITRGSNALKTIHPTLLAFLKKNI